MIAMEMVTVWPACANANKDLLVIHVLSLYALMIARIMEHASQDVVSALMALFLDLFRIVPSKLVNVALRASVKMDNVFVVMDGVGLLVTSKLVQTTALVMVVAEKTEFASATMGGAKKIVGQKFVQQVLEALVCWLSVQAMDFAMKSRTVFATLDSLALTVQRPFVQTIVLGEEYALVDIVTVQTDTRDMTAQKTHA